MGIVKQMQLEEAEREYAKHLREVRARAEGDGLWDDFQDEELLDAFYEAMDKDD